MTNSDMVKKSLRQEGRPAEASPVSVPGAPEPNPPKPIAAYDFQRDPRYPELDPMDSNQLKPSLDKR
jgi:hypothetical protein